MNHLKGIQQRQGIYEQVSRVRAMCRDIYDYAKVTGRIDYNPLEGIQKYLQQGKKENMAHVSEAELPTLIRATLYTTNFTEPLSYQDSAFLKLPKFP